MKKKMMQLGRSMVEMLGVLTVIGVLSIVGLQGYRRAMNKIHANELMDLVTKVYNEHYAQIVVGNSPVGGYLCSNALPSGVTKNAAYIARCSENNLGMDRPSWALNSFTIVSYRISATSHSIYVGGVGNCDICSELKSMTDDGTAGYRLVAGNSSVKIFCLKGTNTDTGTANSNGNSLQCVF